MKTKKHDEKSVEDVLKFFRNLEQKPEIKDFLAKPLKEINEQINHYEAERDKYLEWPLGRMGLSENDLSALTQESGNFNTKNSDELNAIKTAMRDMNAARVSGEPITETEISGYKGFFDACAKYLFTHNPDAGSKSGKPRQPVCSSFP